MVDFLFCFFQYCPFVDFQCCLMVDFLGFQHYSLADFWFGFGDRFLFYILSYAGFFLVSNFVLW